VNQSVVILMMTNVSGGWLPTEGLIDTMGLFRVRGRLAQIKELKNMLNAGMHMRTPAQLLLIDARKKFVVSPLPKCGWFEFSRNRY